MPTTSNFGWTTPADTDLVKDGAAAIRTLGNGIDTSFVDLKGGTTGQILSKASNTDLDFSWIANDQGDITAVTAGTGITGGGTTGAVTITNDMATTITASGDIVVGTGNATYDNLPIGTTGQVLTADTTVSPYKVKWATPATFAPQLVQIATGTLSGASVTISSLSSYDNLYIRIIDCSSATGSNVQGYLRINNNSGANYDRWGYGSIAGGAPIKINASGATFMPIDSLEVLEQSNESPSAAIHITLENCKQAYYTNGYVSSFYKRNDASLSQEEMHFVYKVNEAVSSIVLGGDGGNWGGGTYTIWGS